MCNFYYNYKTTDLQLLERDKNDPKIYQLYPKKTVQILIIKVLKQ